MTLRISDVKNCEFQSNLIEVEPSSMLQKQCETTKNQMDIEESNSNELSIDLCLDDSDTDDIYIVDDNLRKVSSDKFMSQLSSPLIITREFCGNTCTSHVDQDSSCTVVDIEILEENNNDPNNNLDSIESFEEQPSSTLMSSDDSCKRKCAKRLSSPIPGCSKDFDDSDDTCKKKSTEYLSTSTSDCNRDFDNDSHSLIQGFSKDFDDATNTYKIESAECSNSSAPNCCENFNDIQSSTLDEKLQEEAAQIQNLLPKFKYETVYSVLCKNRDAENRIELCLWDLLPFKRPMVKLPSKRKIVDDNSLKKYLDSEDVIIVDDDNLSNKQNPLNTNNVKDTALQENCENNEPKRHSGNNFISTTNGILRPAKLLINHEPPCIENSMSLKYSILSPSKLTYVTAPQSKIQTNEKITSVSTYKDKGITSSKNIPFGRNVFLSNSTNLSVSDNNDSKGEIFDKYIQYPQFIQSTKRQKLSGKLKNFDIETQNKVRQIFLQSQFTNHNTNSSQFVDDKRISETSNSVNVSCSNNMANNSINEKTEAINLHSSFKNASSNVMPESSNVVLPESTTDNLITEINLKNLSESESTSTRIVSNSMASDIVSTSIATSSNNTFFVVPSVTAKVKTTNCLVTVSSEPSTSNTKDSTSYVKEAFGDDNKKKINWKENVALSPQFEDEELHLVKRDFKQRKNYDKEDELLAYLSGIFPNADLEYLKKIVTRMNGNQEAIINFIQSQWEHPTYPTKEDRLKRIKIKEQQKRYTINFDVKQYLKIFPDPFKYFNYQKRQCKFNVHAFQFLKSYFKQIKEHTLMRYYNKYNYHLTATVTALERVQPNKTCDQQTYSWKKYPVEDIPLLQECAFIVHKAEIEAYMNKLKEKEIQEFEKLKVNKELLECQCCYDNECMPSKCSTCNDGHIFCNSCIIKGTESKLAQGETRISCFVDCDGEFSLPTLQKLLSPTQFSILIGRKQEEEIMAAGLEGLVSCPFCHFASIPPPEDKVFKCLNPECMKESCRLCKKLNHIPLKCYEEVTDKARLFLEEKMTEALLRKCYKCGRSYFKEDGCNKISCTCGAIMCYICDKQITGYLHFNDGGSNASNLCPLWSDNRFINTTIVEEVAKKTIEHIAKEDPNIKLNSSNLLLCNNKAGGSTCSTNGTKLSERVKKITNFNT